ncbi:helix-turn-helix transcriptional regulator [Gelidibacter salicanalis]|uniref:Helix-turn-helix transcriptional regulator n=1 Tax=Gelidibacter salicanalis TaxID=291193 RepID=A0A934KU74_9FLAO|nr:AraC family transcriptional regulator [Gelidibacter salicanalis]MBJ7882110.1 helix-turn-helix transcriptional regulator [Gelidibacter salicanalis]
MITIASKVNDFNSFFETLKSEIGGTLAQNTTEYKLEIDNDIARGSIRSIALEDGLAVLEFNLTAYQNIQITIDALLKGHVNFMYCSKGKLTHSFDRESPTNTIDAFQTSIVANIISGQNIILLEKDIETVATLITVNTSHEENKSSQWSSSLREAFISNKTEDYFYVGSYNLKIAENIKQLQCIKQDGLVRQLLTKGIVNVILALEIDHHNKDVQNLEMEPTSLNRVEIGLISKLTEYINEYPDLDHKVENLSDRVGLSAAKLQEGFKFQHGLTICEYIRSVRLTKSEELIINTDLNISEIVYSVGFTSRSYFSKIFKERYDCTPSDYKKNKVAVSA